MKYPIALLVNDLHISKDNISEFMLNWQEMLEVCKREGVTEIIVGGDMFTDRSSQPLHVLKTVREALESAFKASCFVTIAEGNHDCPNPESEYGYNHLFNGFSGVEAVGSHKLMYWEDCDFVLVVMSYFPENGSFLERLEAATKDALESYPDIAASKKDIILYLHEGVQGALGDFDTGLEVPQEPLKGYKKVLCGHYHNRTKIKGTEIEYIGSSRQHNFGEDEEKGYTLLYEDGSTSFVKNRANTRYRTMTATAKTLASLKLEPEPNCKYRLKIRCDEKDAQMIDRQAYIEMGFSKVELLVDRIDETESPESGISEKYDLSGIRKEYQSYCDENGIDSSLGLKYLEE